MKYKLDDLFVNKTISEVKMDTSSFFLIESLLYLGSATGIMSNLIIIIGIVLNKGLRSRTNLILLNYAFNDALFLFTVPLLIRHLYVFIATNRPLGCFTMHTNFVFPFNCVGMMMMLLVDSKHFSFTGILCAMYLFTIFSTVTIGMLCMIHAHIPITFLSISFIYLIFYMALLLKEFSITYRICLNRVERDFHYRLTIVRIFLYNWFMVLTSCLLHLLFALPIVIVNISMVSVTLTSCYILVYVCACDQDFKTSMQRTLLRQNKAHEAELQVSYLAPNSHGGIYGDTASTRNKLTEQP